MARLTAVILYSYIAGSMHAHAQQFTRNFDTVLSHAYCWGVLSELHKIDERGAVELCAALSEKAPQPQSPSDLERCAKSLVGPIHKERLLRFQKPTAAAMLDMPPAQTLEVLTARRQGEEDGRKGITNSEFDRCVNQCPARPFDDDCIGKCLISTPKSRKVAICLFSQEALPY